MTLYRLLRIGISISLITFLLSRVDIVELAKALKSANLWWFLVALLLAFSEGDARSTRLTYLFLFCGPFLQYIPAYSYGW